MMGMFRNTLRAGALALGGATSAVAGSADNVVEDVSPLECVQDVVEDVLGPDAEITSIDFNDASITLDAFSVDNDGARSRLRVDGEIYGNSVEIHTGSLEFQTEAVRMEDGSSRSSYYASSRVGGIQNGLDSITVEFGGAVTADNIRLESEGVLPEGVNLGYTTEGLLQSATGITACLNPGL